MLFLILFTLVIITILIISSLAAYFILKMNGIKQRIWKRSFIFGTTQATFLIILPVSIGIFIQPIIGLMVGLSGAILCYRYINKVLNITWWQNAAIIAGISLLLITSLFTILFILEAVL